LCCRWLSCCGFFCDCVFFFFFFFFQAEDGIRDLTVTGVQTCALPILLRFQLIRTLKTWPTLPAWTSSRALAMCGMLRCWAPTCTTRFDFAWASRTRSEERRVGKECRSGWREYKEKKKRKGEGRSEGKW